MFDKMFKNPTNKKEKKQNDLFITQRTLEFS